MAPIYKMTTRRYNRPTPGTRWREDGTEVTYMSREWFKALTSESELAFWRACGTCRASRDNWRETVEVTRWSPDKLEKRVEVFEPVKCNPWRNAGNRERAILEHLPEMRLLPVAETVGAHVCVKLAHDDAFCLLDLATGLYVA